MQSHLLEFRMERAMGIEPTSLAWEAGILPMNYARESLTLLFYHHLKKNARDRQGIFEGGAENLR